MSRMVIAAAMAAFATGASIAADAATIDPSDFDRKFTEGKRTATLDGADLTGFGWNAANNDVKTLDVGALAPGDDLLLVGRVGAGGADLYISNVADGLLQVDVINFGEFSRTAAGDVVFGARFQLFVNDVLQETLDLFGAGAELVENRSFAPILTEGDVILLRIYGLQEIIDFDIGVHVAAEKSAASASPSFFSAAALTTVPLPASLPLLSAAAALFGMAGLRRRRG